MISGELVEISSGGWFSCSFWYDLWCGDFPFKKTSFQIFLLRLAVDKEASMDYYWSLKMTEVGVGILSFLSCYRIGN